MFRECKKSECGSKNCKESDKLIMWRQRNWERLKYYYIRIDEEKPIDAGSKYCNRVNGLYEYKESEQDLTWFMSAKEWTRFEMLRLAIWK